MGNVPRFPALQRFPWFTLMLLPALLPCSHRPSPHCSSWGQRNCCRGSNKTSAIGDGSKTTKLGCRLGKVMHEAGHALGRSQTDCSLLLRATMLTQPSSTQTRTGAPSAGLGIVGWGLSVKSILFATKPDTKGSSPNQGSRFDHRALIIGLGGCQSAIH